MRVDSHEFANVAVDQRDVRLMFKIIKKKKKKKKTKQKNKQKNNSIEDIFDLLEGINSKLKVPRCFGETRGIHVVNSKEILCIAQSFSQISCTDQKKTKIRKITCHYTL